MENPDRNAGAAQGGAYGGDEAPSETAPSQPGRNRGPDAGDPAQARDRGNALQPKPRPGKRRKRRRGRKVFARDGAAVAPANPTHPAGGAAAAGTDARQKPAAPGERGERAMPAPQSSGAGAGSGGRRAERPFQSNNQAGDANTSCTSEQIRRPQRQGGAGSGPEQARRAPRATDLPVYAALDLGTNNCRLLVAVPTRPGQFRVIDAFSRIVRLGEGLSASGRLGQPAMDRAVEALKVCADKLRARRVRRARLIATEACRSAENGVEFLARVEEEAGLTLEIIDRQTEARLAVSGCGSLVERGIEGVVLFDIGGGSSEIALVDVSRHRTPRLANHIVSWTSLPVGVVSLAERFGGRDVTPAVFEAMVDEVSGMLDRFEGRTRLSHLAAGDRFHLLGTSGTVTTLAGVHLGLERYDRRRVDGLWMNNGEVDAMIARLLGWDFEQRVANACIGADRADLVLAGCAILEAIRRHWPAPRLRVADRGLREGMLSELMADDGAWRRSGRRGGSAQ